MSPQEASASRSRPGFGMGLAAGLGVAVCVLLARAGVEVLAHRASADPFGSKLPVVVAAQDVPAGTLLTIDLLSQRYLPMEFVTSSVVRPDAVSEVLNQRVQAPMLAGDLLLWSQVDPKEKNALFLTRDVAAGALVGEPDLEERAVPPALLTPSWVTPKDRPQTVGRRLVAPFRAGDPLLWTHFKAEGAP